MVAANIPILAVQSEQSSGGFDDIRNNIAQREIPGALSDRIALAKVNRANSDLTHGLDHFCDCGFRFLKIDQSAKETLESEFDNGFVIACVDPYAYAWHGYYSHE